MEPAAISADGASGRSLSVCAHCGAPTKAGRPFCCSGCEAASAAKGSIDADSAFAVLATDNEDGSHSLTLGVEGIHCASCIRLIENALSGGDGVTDARVNMSTERLTVCWTGPRANANTLAQSVTKLGYKLHALKDNAPAQSDQEKRLLRAIAVSGFAAANMMLLSMGLWASTAETMGMATRDLMHWISALIALPTVIYAGQPFFSSAISVLKERRTNMDVPISLAVVLASAMSLFETVNHGEHVYFDSAVMLLFFLLIGRYLDARAKGKARSSAGQLLSRLQGFASVEQDGRITEVPIRDLREGMVARVAVGESIPADGQVQSGTSSVDLSLITGETVPEEITAGSEVFAGTLNLEAPIRIEVSKASEKSLLSEIVKLMEVAEQGASRYVRIADTAARLYTPVIHSMGALTFLGWWLIMNAPWQVSLLNAVTVLIITCPCALGLAVPVVQVLASSRLMKRGILLKSGDALEKMAAIDAVVFDKTGTLTLGRPELTSTSHNAQNMAIAASMATHSKHPLSAALARAHDAALVEMDVSEVPGKGLEATRDGIWYQLGSRSWCGPKTEDTEAALEMWLAADGTPVERFTFADQVRHDARTTVAALKHAGLDVRLLSGDREAVAASVSEAVGISAYEAGVSPVDKCDRLKALQAEGSKVLMAGDGLNDAAAMAFAHVSISPASAVDITQNTADVVFQGDQLAPVATTYAVAKKAMQLVKQNFALAVVYNIIAIPLAIMGHVTPLVAAIAMSGSSLVVILNSFRLTLKREG